MKRFFALLICLCAGVGVIAQKVDVPDISGNWYSVLKVGGGKKLRLNIELKKVSDSIYNGGLVSPDQSPDVFPLDRVALHGDTLSYELKARGMSYKGVWDYRTNAYMGFFQQGGMRIPLFYNRNETTAADVKPNRPQTPQPPFHYLSQEVLIPNDSGKLTLAGTFTRPAKNKRYPVVIMITGSGPQDRDENLFEHRPFFVIADQLTNAGVAVLRFDDRGTGASTGTYKNASTKDFAGDVRAVLAYLRTRPDVDLAHIGLLGHSEGAEVAQMVAADNPEVAFVISLGGPGVKGKDMMLKQNEEIFRSSGVPDSVVKKMVPLLDQEFTTILTEGDLAKRKEKVGAIATSLYVLMPEAIRGGMTDKQYVYLNLAAALSPEYEAILAFDPADYLPRIHCPFLAIGGSKDIQVNADQNLKGIETQLRKGGNNNITIRKFEGLNHLMQSCTTCTLAEYGELEETISPAVVDLISNWLTLLPQLSTK